MYLVVALPRLGGSSVRVSVYSLAIQSHAEIDSIVLKNNKGELSLDLCLRSLFEHTVL